jgi:hypothetical protein
LVSSCVLLLTGVKTLEFAGKSSSSPGSLPYRQRSGDCSRVLTCLRWVKPVAMATEHHDTDLKMLTAVTAVT